jgi:hypothetical protein
MTSHKRREYTTLDGHHAGDLVPVPVWACSDDACAYGAHVYVLDEGSDSEQALCAACVRDSWDVPTAISAYDKRDDARVCLSCLWEATDDHGRA